MRAQERRITVDGLTTHYRTAGAGPPLVLLHGDGEGAMSWQWVLPALARTHRVYAPDLPGFGESAKPAADYSPAFFARFVVAFLDTLGIERTALAGHSLGGLIALHVALSHPARVTALCLVDSSGLGREVHTAQALETAPGVGEAAIAWGRTPLGAAQRVQTYLALNYWRPERVPAAWQGEMYRLGQLPGVLEATVAAKRAIIDLAGQRQVMLGELPRLTMPTLVVWGTRDLTVPCYQAQDAVARLPRGRLALIPDCGHTPHVERPDLFIAALSRFLTGDVPSQPATMPPHPAARSRPVTAAGSPPSSPSAALPQPTMLPAARDEDGDTDPPPAILPHSAGPAQPAAATARTAESAADVAQNLRAAVGRVMGKLRETVADVTAREHSRRDGQ